MILSSIEVWHLQWIVWVNGWFLNLMNWLRGDGRKWYHQSIKIEKSKVHNSNQCFVEQWVTIHSSNQCWWKQWITSSYMMIMKRQRFCSLIWPHRMTLPSMIKDYAASIIAKDESLYELRKSLICWVKTLTVCEAKEEPNVHLSLVDVYSYR